MLFFVDTQKGFIEYLPKAITQLPVLMILALASYVIRYSRWFLLFRWANVHTPVWRGWLAYISGFAFTATPGKVGELVRVRYFESLKISPSRVISAFVFERGLDLLVVFCLATIWVVSEQMLALVAVFVFVFLSILMLAILRTDKLSALGVFFSNKGWLRLSNLMSLMAVAMSNCRVWFKPWPLLVSIFLGMFAWSITALGFVYLLREFSLDVPFWASMSMYPLAMLTGAASMLPGGIGSTEAAIVMQLQWHGVPVAAALLCAVIVRLGTMWFSVVCGLIAILIQEIKFIK